MPALTAWSSARELVPGDPDGVDALARELLRYAEGAVEAAGFLRAVEAGAWVGPASEAFRERIDTMPVRLERGADAFADAARALSAFADEVREGRRQAERAIDLVRDADAATAAWQAALATHAHAERAAASTAERTGQPVVRPGGAPSSYDPGELLREQAHAVLGAARDQVELQGERSARAVEAAEEHAPDEPGLLDRALGQVGEFFKGAGEATWDLGEFAFKLTPTYLLLDPDGFVEHKRGLADGLVYGAQNPTEFAKAVVDWDTWRDNPARALGHLVPDLLLALGTAGAGTAGVAASRGAGAARRLDDVAEVGAVASRQADAAADGAAIGGRAADPHAAPTPGSGQVHYNAVYRPGPLADPSAGYVGRQADTFRNGSYTGQVLDEPLVVHRYWGGPAREGGSFWTPGLPAGPGQAQLGNAINPDWNDFDRVTVQTAPAGTTVYRGPAAPQEIGPAVPLEPGRTTPSVHGPGRLLGGDEQVFFPELPPAWGLSPRG